MALVAGIHRLVALVTGIHRLVALVAGNTQVSGTSGRNTQVSGTVAGFHTFFRVGASPTRCQLEWAGE